MVGQYTFCGVMGKRRVSTRDPGPRNYLKADILRHSSLPEKILENAQVALRISSPFTESEVYALLVKGHLLHGKHLERIWKLK